MVFGNLLIAVGQILGFLLNIYMWIIIISALISWVSPDPYNPIVRFLYSATEPVLRPIRRRIGVFGGFDFSPIVVILAIIFLKSFIVRSLIEYGYRLKGGM